MRGRLSTCATCAATSDWEDGDGWAHLVMPTPRHNAEPDDGAVSSDGPRCDYCGDTQTVDDGEARKIIIRHFVLEGAKVTVAVGDTKLEVLTLVMAAGSSSVELEIRSGLTAEAAVAILPAQA